MSEDVVTTEPGGPAGGRVRWWWPVPRNATRPTVQGAR